LIKPVLYVLNNSLFLFAIEIDISLVGIGVEDCLEEKRLLRTFVGFVLLNLFLRKLQPSIRHTVLEHVRLNPEEIELIEIVLSVKSLFKSLRIALKKGIEVCSVLAHVNSRNGIEILLKPKCQDRIDRMPGKRLKKDAMLAEI
jgi:hypothetical protein